MTANNPDNKRMLNPKVQKRLATYSAAANVAVMSGLVLSGVAHANPVRIEIDPDAVHTAVGYNNGFPIDFDRDGNNEFRVVRLTTFTNNSMILDRSTNGGDVGTAAVAATYGPLNLDYAKALNMSIDIGPSRTDFIQGPAVFYLGYGPYGYFPGAGDKYVGVRFRLNGNMTDFYYGWIQLELSPDSTSVTIKAYGYNDTPNAPIPTAVSLQNLSATAAAPWWRPAAIAISSLLTALSLWWRRRAGRTAA